MSIDCALNSSSRQDWTSGPDRIVIALGPDLFWPSTTAR